MLQFTAVGNLVKDAEIRQLNDYSVISFTLALNRKYGDTESSTFLPCQYWVKKDGIMPYLTKGRALAVAGDWYENRKDDKDRYWQSFTVRNLKLMGGNDAQTASNGAKNDATAVAGSNTSQATQTAQNAARNEFIDDEEDDLPF